MTSRDGPSRYLDRNLELQLRIQFASNGPVGRMARCAGICSTHQQTAAEALLVGDQSSTFLEMHLLAAAFPFVFRSIHKYGVRQVEAGEESELKAASCGQRLHFNLVCKVCCFLPESDLAGSMTQCCKALAALPRSLIFLKQLVGADFESVFLRCVSIARHDENVSTGLLALPELNTLADDLVQLRSSIQALFAHREHYIREEDPSHLTIVDALAWRLVRIPHLQLKLDCICLASTVQDHVSAHRRKLQSVLVGCKAVQHHLHSLKLLLSKALELANEMTDTHTNMHQPAHALSFASLLEMWNVRSRFEQKYTLAHHLACVACQGGSNLSALRLGIEKSFCNAGVGNLVDSSQVSLCLAEPQPFERDMQCLEQKLCKAAGSCSYIKQMIAFFRAVAPAFETLCQARAQARADFNAMRRLLQGEAVQSRLLPDGRSTDLADDEDAIALLHFLQCWAQLPQEECRALHDKACARLAAEQMNEKTLGSPRACVPHLGGANDLGGGEECLSKKKEDQDAIEYVPLRIQSDVADKEPCLASDAKAFLAELRAQQAKLVSKNESSGMASEMSRNTPNCRPYSQSSGGVEEVKGVKGKGKGKGMPPAPSASKAKGKGALATMVTWRRRAITDPKLELWTLSDVHGVECLREEDRAEFRKLFSRRP